MGDTEEPGREHRNHDKHTFHVPNFFARASRSTRNHYSTVPGGEEEEDEEEGDEEAMAEDVGVEGSQTWQTMTSTHQILVRLAFGIFGAAVLLPFNALITPSEYYRSLLAQTSKEKSFMSWIIAVFSISSILFGAHATTSMQRASVSGRVITSAAVIISVLLMTTVVVLVVKGDTSAGPSTMVFPLLMALSVVLSAGTSYLQLAVVTLANSYGPACMGTMLAGQGVVGASVSLVQLITAISASARSSSPSALEGHDEPRKAAYQFFAANTAFMIVGLATFLLLQRSTLFAEMQLRMDNAKSTLADILEQDAARQEQEGGEASNHRIASVSGIKRYMSLRTQQQFSRVASTQKKVVVACLSITYIFAITLALFPALTARVRPKTTALPTIVFVALHFFVFNMGDLTGRSLPSIVPRIFLIRKVYAIAALCLLRTAFIPLLAYCNIPSPSTSMDPSGGGAGGGGGGGGGFGDVAFFVLMALLGISNGLLATSIFVVGPHQENLTEPNDQSLAAGLLSWWLTFGLAIGSLGSFVVAASV